MKTKIWMSNPYYIIKPEEGIVVCKIRAASDIRDVFDCFGFHRKPVNKLIKKFNLSDIETPREFSAITKLRKGDKWDVTLGKRIAESKCKRNIFKFYYRLYTECIECLLQEIAKFNLICDATLYAAQKENKHLKELIGNEDNNR